MQCNQPFCGNNLSAFGQFYNCNQAIPYNNTIPEIVGEGEVIPIVAPDGTVRFFFVPTSPRFEPCPYYFPNYYPIWSNNIKHAWYITNYPNQASIPLFASQRQPSVYFPQSDGIDCNMISPEYKIKFHNDAWCSTTDLHYFIPLTRTCDWSIPYKCNAITQIEVPFASNSICHCRVVYDTPCCPAKCCKGKDRFECHCRKVSREDSPMAVDSKYEETCCIDNVAHAKDNLKCTSHGDTKSNDVKCECNEAQKSGNNDKSVTTYADQGSGCVADVCCETRAIENSKCAGTVIKHETINLSRVKPEIWQPKTAISKKGMKTKSSESLPNNSESRTGSCSCTDYGSQ